MHSIQIYILVLIAQLQMRKEKVMKRLKNITNSLVKSYILFNFAAKIKEI